MMNTHFCSLALWQQPSQGNKVQQPSSCCEICIGSDHSAEIYNANPNSLNLVNCPERKRQTNLWELIDQVGETTQTLFWVRIRIKNKGIICTDHKVIYKGTNRERSWNNPYSNPKHERGRDAEKDNS